MKLAAFQAGVLRQRFQYKSFEPAPINHERTSDDPVINTLLEDANRAVGELNAFSLIVPEIDWFIRMHVAKEAQTAAPAARVAGPFTSQTAHTR